MGHAETNEISARLTRKGRYPVLAFVFLGRMFAGVEMGLMIPAARPAIQDFLTAGESGCACRKLRPRCHSRTYP